MCIRSVRVRNSAGVCAPRNNKTANRAFHRALKPDGIDLMQDIAGPSDVEKNKPHPLGPFIDTISCLNCMSVSLAQGGSGLGVMWGE